MAIEDFHKKLEQDPDARQRVISDMMHVLQKHGVDTNDPATLEALGMDTELNALPDLPGGPRSTIIITITK